MDAMIPQNYKISNVTKETFDVFTLELEPAQTQPLPRFSHGQFNMVYLFGHGEVPISISGGSQGRLFHTIRSVGSITNAMATLKVGDVVGLRGPFGNPWPIEHKLKRDLIFIAGGIGLAPLMSSITFVSENRSQFGKVYVLIGARTPKDLLFTKQLRTLAKQQIEILTTVDNKGSQPWKGSVGFVTNLIPQIEVNPLKSSAFICGPEIMMRFSAQALLSLGVKSEEVFLSMERNMKCAVALCGHCQWGPHFICKNGPVFSYKEISHLLAVREL